MADIQYPIALRKGENVLVHAKDAANGKACKCFCVFCGEDMIAVNQGKIQRPHFKHDSGSDCSGGYETYIHWLTKEVFKEIREIKLPPIVGIKGFHASQKVAKELLRLYAHYDVPKPFMDFCEVSIFQDTTELLFDSVETEKVFQTEEGEIRVDIVLQKDNELLFVEPFVTHQIDFHKIQKLNTLDVSTISIDLRQYSINTGCLDSMEEFKTRLINDLDSKGWAYIRKRKIDSLITKALKRIEGLIKEHIEEIKLYNDSSQSIDRIEYEQYTIRNKLDSLRKDYLTQVEIRQEVSSKWKSTKKEL